MPASSLIARYGLLAIGVGAGVEGEPFALAGGAFARVEGIGLGWAIAAAIGGAVAIDQLWFLFSRSFRDHAIVRAAAARPAFARALERIESRRIAFIVMFRFAYGARAVAPIALGVSGVRYGTYLVLNVVSGCAWGALYTLIGYVFGARIEDWYGAMSPFALGTAAAVAIIGSGAAIAFTLRADRMPGA